MQHLSPEMVLHIASFMPPACECDDALNFALVCRNTNTAIKSRKHACIPMDQKGTMFISVRLCLLHSPERYLNHARLISDTILDHIKDPALGTSFVHFQSHYMAMLACEMCSDTLDPSSTCCGGLGVKLRLGSRGFSGHSPNMQGCCVS